MSTYKIPESRVGYVSKSQSGNSVITVEQDMTLKKGDKLILQKPAEIIKGLQQRGVLTEEVAQERLSKVPEWKTHEVSKLPPMKK
jgi:hypothetical protein